MEFLTKAMSQPETTCLITLFVLAAEKIRNWLPKKMKMGLGMFQSDTISNRSHFMGLPLFTLVAKGQLNFLHNVK